MIDLSFDNGTVEQFTLVLSQRDFTHLGALSNVDHIKLKRNLNAADELSFEVYKDYSGHEEVLWDDIYDLRLIWISELNEYFEIDVESTDTVYVKKTVTAKSLCESELSQTYLNKIEINTADDIARDDYDANYPTVFYRELSGDPESAEYKKLKNASLLHRVMEKVPAYKVGHVDDSLKNLQRVFSIQNTTLYNFLTGECSEQFNCLFQFDSATRTINAYDLLSVCNETTACPYWANVNNEYYPGSNHLHYRGFFNDKCPICGSSNIQYFGEDTTVFVSTENLTDEVKFDTDVNSMKNCFRLEAGDDDMTAAVINSNPNGTRYIYEFNQETRKDMPKELVEIIDAYDKEYDEYYNTKPMPLDYTKIGAYNNLCAKYNQNEVYNNGSPWEIIPNPVKGYKNLMPYYYNCIDFYSYLKSSMMPDPVEETYSIDQELSHILSGLAGLMPAYIIGLSSTIDAQTSAESAINNICEIFINTGVYKIEVTTSSDGWKPNDVGTAPIYDDEGHFIKNIDTKGKWTGKIKLISYEDDTVTKESSNLTLRFTIYEPTYLEQNVSKFLKRDKETADLYDVVTIPWDSKSDGYDFKQQLKLYSSARLESFQSAIDGVISVLTEAGAGNEKNEDFIYPEVSKTTISQGINPKKLNLYLKDAETGKYVLTTDETFYYSKTYYFISSVEPVYIEISKDEAQFEYEHNGNPKSMGWYEYVWIYNLDKKVKALYRVTPDTSVYPGKTYYHYDDKLKFTKFEAPNVINPKANNWYEKNSDGDYVKTKDTKVKDNKTYYTRKKYSVENPLYNDFYWPYKQKSAAVAGELGVRNNEVELVGGALNTDGTYNTKGMLQYIVDAINTVQNELNFAKYVYNHTYTKVVDPTGNPTFECWYEKDGNNYVLTSDTRVVSGKTYYKHSYDLYYIYTTYIREDTYSNANYISTDLDNNQLFENAGRFLELAKDELHKSATYQHSISTNINNLVAIPEFKPLLEHFELGNWIRVREDETIYRLRLISYSIDFDNIQQLDTEFSDVTITADGLNDINSILNQATSMASSYSYVQQQAADGADVMYNYIDDWVDNGLNSALIRINNNTDEDISIDNAGITAKTYDDVHDEYGQEQLKITHNLIAFTENNWETVSTALGKFNMTHHHVDTDGINHGGDADNYDAYGLVAQAVLSGWVVGSYMEAGTIIASHLQNVGNSCYIDLVDGQSSGRENYIQFTKPNTQIVNFSVSKTGDVTVNGSGTFNGKIEANEGYIGGTGGWAIRSGYMTVPRDNGPTTVDATNVTGTYLGTGGIMNSNGSSYVKLKGGTLTANNVVITGSGNNNNALNLGNGAFTVTNNGKVSASNVEIKGGSISIKKTDGTVVFDVDNTGDAHFNGDISGATGTFKGGINTSNATINGGSITIKNGNNTIFSATSGGTVSVNGKIITKEGEIGDWKIESATGTTSPYGYGALHNIMDTTATSTYILSPKGTNLTGDNRPKMPGVSNDRRNVHVRLGPNFAIDTDGNVFVTGNGTFGGTITATAGTIGGCTINSNGSLIIPAGHIQTGSIISTNYTPSDIFTSKGSIFDLNDGTIITPGFRVDGADGNTWIKGTIYASAGNIGNWDINSNGIYKSVGTSSSQTTYIRPDFIHLMESSKWRQFLIHPGNGLFGIRVDSKTGDAAFVVSDDTGTISHSQSLKAGNYVSISPYAITRKDDKSDKWRVPFYNIGEAVEDKEVLISCADGRILNLHFNHGVCIQCRYLGE